LRGVYREPHDNPKHRHVSDGSVEIGAGHNYCPEPQSMEAVDLLERMLVFDLRTRITAAEALLHPYMADNPIAPTAA